MNILILEDEPLAVLGIENILTANFEDVEIIDKAQSIAEGASLLLDNSNHYDLIISDIRLTDGVSFELHSKSNHNIPIIFTTAYDEYALQAFENNGIAYVLKPINEEKLVTAINKAREFFINRKEFSKEGNILEKLSKHFQANQYKKKFLGKIGNKVVFLNVDQISSFYIESKVVFMQDQVSEKKFIINHSLEELENELLDPDRFYRINRSTIINLEALQEMKNYTNGRLQLKMKPSAHSQWIVARERVSQFKEWINQ